MKKILAVLVSLTMAASLAACGAPASSSSGVSSGAPEATPSGSTPVAELSGKVATNGSTSMEKVIGALAEAFMQQNGGVDVTYDPTGSGAGITAAEEGTTDIGLSSRALKDTETGLTSTVVALDGIAVIVNKSNTVKDLTVEQIAKLANGEFSNWKDVGGKDAPVVMIGREAGSGTRDGFETITGVKDNAKYGQELTATGAVIAAVEANENAIGYASLSSVKDTVAAIMVEGVAPSEAAVLDGTYKIQRPFLMVTKEGEKLRPEVQAFIDFARNKDNAEIITNAGAVPVVK
ncbi:phosphate ABC transporter substrate-binding protein [Hydrogenoanaerobacterium sp.]|uniref:phosphate ABC transporter substrate-binding protein n=1 Tax=Hydrogenoanaerobacterium sp. TaxID=2953763 RepID=UPI0028A0CA21|nr:phosphate ABC transporter substrate-binding protein [Hydrogenoanaerobacterium sp.]